MPIRKHLEIGRVATYIGQAEYSSFFQLLASTLVRFNVHLSGKHRTTNTFNEETSVVVLDGISKSATEVNTLHNQYKKMGIPIVLIERSDTKQACSLAALPAWEFVQTHGVLPPNHKQATQVLETIASADPELASLQKFEDVIRVPINTTEEELAYFVAHKVFCILKSSWFYTQRSNEITIANGKVTIINRLGTRTINTIQVDNKTIKFSPKEAIIFTKLLKNKGAWVPHDTILAEIFARHEGTRRDKLDTLFVHISRMREKLLAVGISADECILSSRGKGYRIL